MIVGSEIINVIFMKTLKHFYKSFWIKVSSKYHESNCNVIANLADILTLKKL